MLSSLSYMPVGAYGSTASKKKGGGGKSVSNSRTGSRRGSGDRNSHNSTKGAGLPDLAAYADPSLRLSSTRNTLSHTSAQNTPQQRNNNRSVSPAAPQRHAHSPQPTHRQQEHPSPSHYNAHEAAALLHPNRQHPQPGSPHSSRPSTQQHSTFAPSPHTHSRLNYTPAGAQPHPQSNTSKQGGKSYHLRAQTPLLDRSQKLDMLYDGPLISHATPAPVILSYADQAKLLLEE